MRSGARRSLADAVEAEVEAFIAEHADLSDEAGRRRVVRHGYEFQCCVVCGLNIPTCLNVAHFDQQAENNEADNLAYLCQTHHWMFDAGLYPVEAIKLLRAQWQQTKGKSSHKARMKDAGAKAAATRRRKAAARKAVETRRRVSDRDG